MDLINNRYRIQKKLYSTSVINTYLVSDVLNDKKQFELKILNKDIANADIINYLADNFLLFTSYNTSGIKKLFNLNRIKRIDQNRFTEMQFFYTCEYIPEFTMLRTKLDALDFQSKIDIFIKICHAINSLHVKGYAYGYINPSNIFITNDNNEINIKLEDLTTVYLNRNAFYYYDTKDFLYLSPEMSSGEKVTIKDDIYALGILLKEFFDNDQRFTDLIFKITEANEEARILDMSSVLMALNNILGTNYTVLIKGDMEKINLNTILCGREYELQEVLSTYSKLLHYDTEKRFIFIHGDSGVGKSRFLRELKHRFNIAGANIFSSFSNNLSHSDSFNFFEDICKKVVRECPQSLIEKYQSELIKIIPEVFISKKIIPSESLSSEKEWFKIINSTINFLWESTKDIPTIFIIDDIHLGDKFSLEILEHLYLKSFKNKKVLFIFSYCDEEFSSNQKLFSLINNISEKGNVANLLLRSFDENETALYIKNILNMSFRPVSFSKRIYEKTYGNPLFILEAIKNFFMKGILYVDDNGHWNTVLDFNEVYISLPDNMEGVVINQLKNLSSINLNVLENISIFTKGVSINILINMMNKEEHELIPLLEHLISIGIICKKIEDFGFVFDFYNKLFKDIIYETINANNKISLHKKAAFILRNENINFYQNDEEIIYHLEQAKENGELIHYYLNYARKMESLKNRTEAIEYYKKAIPLFLQSNCYNNIGELYLKIGNIYIDDSNMDLALDSYNKCKEYCLKSDYQLLIIDSINKIADIYLRKNYYETALPYIEEAIALSKKNDYKTGYLESSRNKAKYLYYVRDYKEACDLCISTISLCGEDNEEIKAFIYLNLGNIYLCLSKNQESLDCANKSLKIFQEIGNKQGQIMSLNNLGVIYGDYFQDNSKSIYYLNLVKEICEETNLYSFLILALSNLADAYLCLYEYDKSLSYLEDALAKAQQFKDDENQFFCLFYLAYISMKFCDYASVFKYNNLAKELQKNIKISHNHFLNYEHVLSELFFEIGDLNSSKERLNKILPLYIEDGIKQKYDSELLYHKVSIAMQYNSKNKSIPVHEILCIVKKYASSFDRVTALLDLSLLLAEQNEFSLSKLFYNQCVTSYNKSFPDIIVCKKMYLEEILYNSKGSLQNLEKALIVANNTKQYKLSILINKEIANLYFKKFDYFYAINYCFEACELIKNICLQLPASYRVGFINVNNYVEPFNMLLKIKASIDSTDYSEESLYKEVNVNNISEILSYKKFLDVFSNKYFINSAEKIFSERENGGIGSLSAVLKNLTSDSLYDLDLFTKYLSSITLAPICSIIVEDGDHIYKSLVCTNDKFNPSNAKYVLDKVKSSGKPYISSSSDLIYFEDARDIKTSKVTMCIPVIVEKFNGIQNVNDKRRDSQDNGKIKGYIYLESEKVFNNFNDNTMHECIEVSNLIGVLIEKHKLLISSSMDRLTGTVTRKYLEEELDLQIKDSIENSNYFSIIMFDLDHFKNINDKFGHQTGDEVLKEVCSIALSNLRKTDLIGRYGGEEFIAVLPQTNAQEASVIAEKLRIAVETSNILGETHPVTISLGAATCPLHSQSRSGIIEKADQALYVAKESGRNKSILWTNAYVGNEKRYNKLTGVISGNTVQDSRNVLAILELLELVKSELSKEEMTKTLLGRIIETSESDCGLLITLEDGVIKNVYGRRAFQADFDDIPFNKNIIDKVYADKSGLFLIDWDEITDLDSVTGVPNWNSIVVLPIISKGIVKAVLYLKALVTHKEFNYDDYNFLRVFQDICSAVLF